MRFFPPRGHAASTAHPKGGPRIKGKSVQLGYCLNLHPAETLDDVQRALETFVLPLRSRLGLSSDELFGVGMYLSHGAARTLRQDASKLEALAEFLRGAHVDPYTFNAFPYGGFQEDGLKERVYAPSWLEQDRLDYTVDVAHVAAALNGARVGAQAPGSGHVSISTHPGAYGTDITDRSGLRRCAEQFGRAVGEIARIEKDGGPRVVLSLESEPDASSRNSRALAEFLVFARLVGSRVLQDECSVDIEESAALMERHLGTCLDCCHSAVEFEAPEETLELSTHGGPLGKIQFSSALRLENPGAATAAREALLALDEPRFLHQVTAVDGASREGFRHLRDLPALSEEIGNAESPWLSAEEWRCHFHVPVDLEEASGLATTRSHADAILAGALSTDAAWTSPELHVEIETYTWSVLGGRSAVPLNDEEILSGLEREYAHVIGCLEGAGWSRESSR